ncbi:MAG: sigma-70 family RNA polymerase sigma factor [Porcipelethomonas sp.]
MEITEANFISQLRKKDQQALEYTVRNYGGLMKSVINSVLRCYPEDAEECLYESVMKIWQHIDSYDEKKNSFSGWAASIAKYTALDRLRKISNVKPIIDIDEIQVADEYIITDNALFNEFFCELIDCLSDEDKLLFIKIFWRGETIEEASLSLGKSKSILYNRISRGKKKIAANNPELLRKEEYP